MTAAGLNFLFPQLNSHHRLSDHHHNSCYVSCSSWSLSSILHKYQHQKPLSQLIVIIFFLFLPRKTEFKFVVVSQAAARLGRGPKNLPLMEKGFFRRSFIPSISGIGTLIKRENSPIHWAPPILKVDPKYNKRESRHWSLTPPLPNLSHAIQFHRLFSRSLPIQVNFTHN